MKKNVIISGCSYTENAIWPKIIFPEEDFKVINLGKQGAGQKYISESIMNVIDLDNPPDFVFMMYSIVNRYEMTVPNNPRTREFAKKYRYTGQVHDTLYFFSTGDRYTTSLTNNYNRIKDESWPEVKTLDDIVGLPNNIKQECIDHKMLHFNSWDHKQLIHTALMLQYLEDAPSTNADRLYHENLCYRSMLNLQNFLELHKIPYMFSFVYTPWVENNVFKYANFGGLTRKSNLHQRINWSKFIDIHPADIGKSKNMMQSDGLHITQECQELWASQVKDKIQNAIPNYKKGNE